MSSKPPFARMRQIRQNARFQGWAAPEPQNVEAALAALPQTEVETEVEAAPEPEVRAEEPEPAELAEPDPEEPVADATPAPASTPADPTSAVPEYNDRMKKTELKAIIEALGLEAAGSKSEMLRQLDKHFGR
ncbi:MAG: hypothetical protein A2Y38_02785 [Spirochaetes bacterium GWB1_59_5]|nr:MAG: hypothetical protein A2Y38_02785 [Spirochaetes bacterium GWB1_59_5]